MTLLRAAKRGPGGYWAQYVGNTPVSNTLGAHNGHMGHTSESAGDPPTTGPPSSQTVQEQGSRSLAERFVGSYRAVWKFLGRRALARATLAVPRTARFIKTTVLTGEVSEGLPAPSVSLGLAAGIAMDEALLAMAMAPSRFPRRADFARVST